MPNLISVNVLSVNKQLPGTPTIGFPGVTPTVASPSPVWGLPFSKVQGVSVYSGTDFPTAQSVVNVSYKYNAQDISVNVYLQQTAASIISGS